MKRIETIERIENKPELKSIFTPIFKEWLFSSGYVNQEECEHFFIKGYEAAIAERAKFDEQNGLIVKDIGEL